MPPPNDTLLDRCIEAGIGVYGVGKIRDIFAGQGITEGRYSDSNDDGVDIALEYLRRPAPALVFVNLVDFDTKYGHRNDPAGYAACVEALDRRVPELLGALDGGVLFVTGDHGCDPTTPSTDHSRELVPVLAGGLAEAPPRDIGARPTFADLGATVGELLGAGIEGLAGESFAADLGL